MRIADRFSGSEVRGQGHDQNDCCSGGGISTVWRRCSFLGMGSKADARARGPVLDEASLSCGFQNGDRVGSGKGPIVLFSTGVWGIAFRNLTVKSLRFDEFLQLTM